MWAAMKTSGQALVAAIALALLASAARGEPTDATKLAGPFPSVDAYCAALPARSIDVLGSAESGYHCAPPDAAAAPANERPSCAPFAFNPAAGGALSEGKQLTATRAGGGADAYACLLAWHVAAGWFVDEQALRSPRANEHHYDYVVAANAIANSGAHGVLASVRVRRVAQTIRHDQWIPNCVDDLLLYGIGESNIPAVIIEGVGRIDDCSAILFDGKTIPPRRWDEYQLEQLLPDNRLRLTELGRKAKSLATKARMTEEQLHFP